MKKPIMLFALAALSGCVNLGLDGGGKNAPEMTYYVLEDAGRAATAPATQPARAVVLTDTQAGAFYDTDNIAFSRRPGTRGTYQFARWTERPGKRMTDLLIERLEREGLFKAVVQTGTNVRGDWLLTTDILDLYHDAATEPGQVRLVLRAEVSDLASRSLLGRKTFVQTVPAASYDVAGAHQAFNKAATGVLNDLADWLKMLSTKN